MQAQSTQSSVGYYVTVKDGKRVGFLLGPYDDHQGALDNVTRGSRLARKADARASFYAFGTAQVKDPNFKPRVVFGAYSRKSAL